MTVLYWDDFVCDEASRAIAHPSTIHEHFMDERMAAHAFLRLRAHFLEVGCYASGNRYACVFVQGRGLVRGVVERR